MREKGGNTAVKEACGKKTKTKNKKKRAAGAWQPGWGAGGAEAPGKVGDVWGFFCLVVIYLAVLGCSMQLLVVVCGL